METLRLSTVLMSLKAQLQEKGLIYTKMCPPSDGATEGGVVGIRCSFPFVKQGGGWDAPNFVPERDRGDRLIMVAQTTNTKQLEFAHPTPPKCCPV